MTSRETDETTTALAARHLRAGWWGLLLFLSLGLILEALHGFKIGFYLDVNNDTRRLMWTLAHAHGVLLSLVQLAFSATIPGLSRSSAATRLPLASKCLLASMALLPGGFFLGGIMVDGGDPWVGVLLVPVGGLLLLVGVLCCALCTGGSEPRDAATDS